MTTKSVVLLVLVILAVVIVFVYTQLTIFVVPPIGAAPQGRTLVISRLRGGHFIDSADAMCKRIQGGVNLLCRGAVLGAVATNATVYVRLPYSKTLYLISTDGQVYAR